MKNILSVLAVLSLGAAFADVTYSTNGETTFGALRVDVGTNREVIISVPWLDPSATESPIAVTNLIKTANLRETDQLYYYDLAEKKYQLFQLNASKVWEPATVVSSSTKYTSAVQNQTLTRGNAIILVRTNECESAIYLYGQVASSGVVTNEMALATTSGDAFTLLAPPSAATTDINTGTTWENVGANDIINVAGTNYNWNAGDQKWGTRTSGLKIEGGKYTLTNGWTYVNVAIPAGQGAWYISAETETPSTKNAKVIWTGMPSAD